jgi:hypothetical protein
MNLFGSPTKSKKSPSSQIDALAGQENTEVRLAVYTGRRVSVATSRNHHKMALKPILPVFRKVISEIMESTSLLVISTVSSPLPI